MSNPARPWTRFYHPLTAHDVVAPRWPHLPAAVREAATTYADRTAFTLALPNGSQGGLTFAEVDRLSDRFAVYLREVAGFKAGDRIALQMPNCLAYPGRGLRDVEGRTRDGEHQPALHRARDGAPVRRQRCRRTDRHRPLRPEGPGRAAEDIDQDGGRGQHLGSAADDAATAGTRGSKVRQEDGAPDHIRAHHVRERVVAGRTANPVRCRPARLCLLAESRQHRRPAIHRWNDRRRQGRGAHSRQPDLPT